MGICSGEASGREALRSLVVVVLVAFLCVFLFKCAAYTPGAFAAVKRHDDAYPFSCGHLHTLHGQLLHQCINRLEANGSFGEQGTSVAAWSLDVGVCQRGAALSVFVFRLTHYHL
jgi:hypothetical protein